MEFGGRRRGPDSVIATRRAQVLLRMSLGMSSLQIGDSLGVPSSTIRRDMKYLRQWKKHANDIDAYAVRARVVEELLALIREMHDRINQEYRMAKKGTKDEEVWYGQPQKGQIKTASDPQVLLDWIEGNLRVTSKRTTTKSFMPRLTGVATLYRVMGEYYRLILNAFDFGQTTKVFEKETERTIIAGVAVIAEKAPTSEAWEKLASAYAEDGKTIEVTADAIPK